MGAASVHTKKVADIVLRESCEVRFLRSFAVFRTHEDFWRIQLVRHDLKRRKDASGCDEFQRSAPFDGNAHGILIALVDAPDFERKRDLFQIAIAANPL